MCVFLLGNFHLFYPSTGKGQTTNCDPHYGYLRKQCLKWAVLQSLSTSRLQRSPDQARTRLSLLKEAHTFEREELPQLNFPFSPHSYYAKASIFFHPSTLKKFSEQKGHGLPLKTCDGHTIYIPLPNQHAQTSHHRNTTQWLHQ